MRSDVAEFRQLAVACAYTLITRAYWPGTRGDAAANTAGVGRASHPQASALNAQRNQSLLNRVGTAVAAKCP